MQCVRPLVGCVRCYGNILRTGRVMQQFGAQVSQQDHRPTVDVVKRLTTGSGDGQGNTKPAADVDTFTDYSYFKDIASKVQQLNKQDGVQCLDAVHTVDSAEPIEEGVVLSSDSSKQLSYPKLVNLQHIQPTLQKKSRNLAAYVNESTVLSNLVKLGVNLSTVEKNVDIATHLVKADYDVDIAPYLLFLHRVGVADTDLGGFVTKNPSIFLESLENLQIRVDYLQSKKFSHEAIARIVTKAPILLSMSVKEVDSHLGYLQKEFRLTGNEVRDTVTRLPKLAVWNKHFINEIKFTMKEFLGFTSAEQKQILLAMPKLYLMAKHALMQRFDYVHNEMGISHKDIVAWPSVLRTRQHITQQRHLFMKHIGRAQFDPTKENFVSLQALVTGRDVEFCDKVAKVPVKQFNDFLKTL